MDNRPLPHGVDQRGNELVIQEANRLHKQQYKCTVTNAVGSSSTTIATLVVFCKYKSIGSLIPV